MPVSLLTWRHRIGCFNLSKLFKRIDSFATEQQSFQSYARKMWSFCNFLDSLPCKILIGILALFLYCLIFLTVTIAMCIYEMMIYFLNTDCPSDCIHKIPSNVILISRFLRSLARHIYTFLILLIIKNLDFSLCVIFILLISSGSIEVNPGPPA